MPWKECSVVEERLRFVARLLDGEAMTELCRSSAFHAKPAAKSLTATRSMASRPSATAGPCATKQERCWSRAGQLVRKGVDQHVEFKCSPLALKGRAPSHGSPPSCPVILLRRNREHVLVTGRWRGSFVARDALDLR